MELLVIGGKVIFADSACPLCREPIGQVPGRIYATWGMFLPLDDPLSRYCDAAIHWPCYEAWPHRERFGRAWIQFWVDAEPHYESICKAYLDDQIFVRVSPPSRMIALGLFRSGMEYQLACSDWAEFVTDPEPSIEHLSLLEREAILSAVPRLRAILPDAEALVAAVDWEAKAALGREREEANRQQQEQWRATLAPYNRACDIVATENRLDGLTCPRCGRHSRSHVLLGNSQDKKRFFICGCCTGTFGPADPAGSQLHGPIRESEPPFVDPT